MKYFEKHQNIGCIGPKILNSDGTLQLACKRSFPNPISAFFKLIGLSRLFPKNKLFGKYNLTYLDENQIHSVEAISGSFMLIPKFIIDKIGIFDESFFMYGEDLDFCHRIKQIGYKIIYNPVTSIIHYKGESSKTAPYDMIHLFYKAFHNYYNKYSITHPSWKVLRYFISIGIFGRKLISYLKFYSTKIISTILDLSSIVFSFATSLSFWYPLYHHENVNLSTFSSQWLLLLNIMICWMISSYWIHLYKKDYLSYGRSLVVSFFAFLLSATSIYFISVIAYSRVVLIMTFLLVAIITASWRIGLYFLYRYQKIKITVGTPFFTRRAAILGTDNKSMRIGNSLHQTPKAHFRLIGYIDENNHSGTSNFLGRFEDVVGIIKNHNINELIIPESVLNIRELIHLLDNLSNININCKLAPSGEKMLIGKGMVENLAGVPLLNIELPLFEKFHQFTKRWFDIVFSSILIFCTFPFHIYYLIYRKYHQEYIWSTEGMQIKIYRYKSDNGLLSDLPLLFMVFNGSLSFVGSQIIPAKIKNPNLIVKPGLMGLPQLKPINIETNYIRDFENYYAMHYSLIFDIEIILKTIFKI